MPKAKALSYTRESERKRAFETQIFLIYIWLAGARFEARSYIFFLRVESLRRSVLSACKKSKTSNMPNIKMRAKQEWRNAETKFHSRPPRKKRFSQAKIVERAPVPSKKDDRRIYIAAIAMRALSLSFTHTYIYIEMYVRIRARVSFAWFFVAFLCRLSAAPLDPSLLSFSLPLLVRLHTYTRSHPRSCCFVACEP